MLSELSGPASVFFAHSAADCPIAHEFQDCRVDLLRLDSVFLHEIAHDA
jgi:hypothetical protein